MLPTPVIFTSLVVACDVAGVVAWGAGGGWPSISYPGTWSSPLIREASKKSDEEILGVRVASSHPRERCFRKKCFHTDHCCRGSVCVDIDGTKVVGACLPVYGKRAGELCQSDIDCGLDMKCLDTPNSVLPRSCQRKGKDLVYKKQYNDECFTSSECDVTKGLCCQVQRRHRMAPRKVCYYFADPESCIGNVGTQYAKAMGHISNPLFKARIG